MNLKPVYVYILVVLLVQISLADQVLLNNGDTLTGTIIKLVDGKLDLASDQAGAITIAQANIRTLATDQAVELHLADGAVLKRKLNTAGAGLFQVEDGPTVKEQALQVKDIVAINPPAKPRPKWTGQLSAGWTSTHGNTKADNQSFSFSAAKRTEKDRTIVSTDYVKGRQEDTTATPPKTITTENWWRAKAKYDYFVSKKIFAYVDGRYEKDSIALLGRRVALGGGGGYQFKETDHTSLSGELGLASLYEKFDDTTATTNSELSLQMGYNLTHRINETLHFSHDLTYYPNTEKFSDYYLTTTAELRANLTKKLFTHVKAIFNYDATPAPGKGGTDVKYILGVGLDF